MKNIKFTIERLGESNKKQTYSIVSGQLRAIPVDTTCHHWQYCQVWWKNLAVEAPDNIILNILSWTRSPQSCKSSARDWTPVSDSYHRYSNSSKLL